MVFELSSDLVHNFMNEAAAGNPGPFAEALDPEVKWRIGSETKDDVAKTGVFNRQAWFEQVYGPLKTKLQEPGIKQNTHAIDVVGNKAYIEFTGEATQNNGKPYNNFYLWVLQFNDHGKIVEIREYLDTGLVREVFVNN